MGEPSKAVSPATSEAKPESELRKAILEALRKPVQKACDESAKETPELKGKEVRDLSWADDLPDCTAWAKRLGAPRALFPPDIAEK